MRNYKGSKWSTADAGIDVVCTNISRGSSRFPLGNQGGKSVRKRSQDRYTLVQIVQDVLVSLGRSWPVLAGLDRIHFIDKGRSGTEVTAKPLEKAKGHRRQEGTD